MCALQAVPVRIIGRRYSSYGMVISLEKLCAALLGRGVVYTLTPRYTGWLDFTNFVRDNGVSGTTGQASVQGNLEFIEIHTD